MIKRYIFACLLAAGSFCLASQDAPKVAVKNWTAEQMAKECMLLRSYTVLLDHKKQTRSNLKDWLLADVNHKPSDLIDQLFAQFKIGYEDGYQKIFAEIGPTCFSTDSYVPGRLNDEKIGYFGEEFLEKCVSIAEKILVEKDEETKKQDISRLACIISLEELFIIRPKLCEKIKKKVGDNNFKALKELLSQKQVLPEEPEQNHSSEKPLFVNSLNTGNKEDDIKVLLDSNFQKQEDEVKKQPIAEMAKEINSAFSKNDSNEKHDCCEQLVEWLLDDTHPEDVADFEFELFKTGCKSIDELEKTILAFIEKNYSTHNNAEELFETIASEKDGFFYRLKGEKWEELSFDINKDWNKLCEEKNIEEVFLEAEKYLYVKRLVIYIGIGFLKADSLLKDLERAMVTDSVGRERFLDFLKRAVKFSDEKFDSDVLNVENYFSQASQFELGSQSVSIQPFGLRCFPDVSSRIVKGLYYGLAVVPQFLAGMALSWSACNCYKDQSFWKNKHNIWAAGFGVVATTLGLYHKNLWQHNFTFKGGYKSATLNRVNTHSVAALAIGGLAPLARNYFA